MMLLGIVAACSMVGYMLGCGLFRVLSLFGIWRV